MHKGICGKLLGFIKWEVINVYLSLIKGIVQQILRGVNNKLKSVLVN
jgi:hypothetical protein